MSKIIKSIFIPEEGRSAIVKIPIPDATQFTPAPFTEQVEESTAKEPEEQAAQILAQAQEKAAALLTQAQNEADKVREEARNQGYQEGRAQGLQEAKQQSAKALAEFDQVTQNLCLQLEDQRREIISSSAEDLLKIIQLFAEKVIRTAISIDPALVKNLLAGALEKVDGVTWVKARLHPDDVNIIRQLDMEKEYGSAATTLELVADPKLPRYSCQVQTPTIAIEASLEEQIAELELALRQALLQEVNDGD